MRERLGEVVLAVHVFGSVARGDATEESDVDVFLLPTRKHCRAARPNGPPRPSKAHPASIVTAVLASTAAPTGSTLSSSRS
ncbi:MAG: nucleotidyltransferase domain-containing protein [Armatimonadota bacterium]